LSDLQADWEEHGPSVLERVRMTDPATYVRVAFNTLPRDLLLSVTQQLPGNLQPEEWALMRSVLSLIQQAQVDAQPMEVFGVIEDALRSQFAKPVGCSILSQAETVSDSNVAETTR
jgi:hypothetical protein